MLPKFKPTTRRPRASAESEASEEPTPGPAADAPSNAAAEVAAPKSGRRTRAKSPSAEETPPAAGTTASAESKAARKPRASAKTQAEEESAPPPVAETAAETPAPAKSNRRSRGGRNKTAPEAGAGDAAASPSTTSATHSQTDSQRDETAAESRPVPSEITLEELSEKLRAAAARANWPSLMPVQAKALPGLMAGRDMIVQARTGSGKTGAFLLPMLERLDPNSDTCQALILQPTRELARQVAHEAETLCVPSGLRCAVVYGGVGYKEQVDALKGGAQIVVGTPGRVLDHLLKRTFTLENLRQLIFDEADRMLSMGFYPDMKQVQRYLPRRHMQKCMFSATFPSYVLRTAREFIPEPEFLTLSEGQVHVTTIEHQWYEVPGLDKDRALVRLIEIENPASAIIFCNTKSRVHYVSTVLQRFGYDADELSADLSQSDRERVLARVRQGTLRFLVATDVAARGLDIPELSHVFQYEPPEDPEAYVHRTGRTGRAGASGIAIALVSDIEKLELNRIGKRFGINLVEKPMPTDEDVATIAGERVTALLEARLRQRDKLHIERSRRFEALGRELADNEDESAIIAMLLDDYYQQSLHAPLVPPSEPPRERPHHGGSGAGGGFGGGGGGGRRRGRR